MKKDGMKIVEADPISIFKIKKNDVISITGAGGKTSLMFRLASKLKERGSVLITTSTKIAIPEEGFDRLFTSYEDYKAEDNLDKGYKVVCLGQKVPDKNKLGSVGYDQLKDIIKDFDYCLIEADGSRRLPFKFWYDYEPVIYDFTSRVIGVLPLSVYGKRPGPDFIYNYEGYMAYLDQALCLESLDNIHDHVIDAKAYKNLITYEAGLFKNFPKGRFVFINQYDLAQDPSKVLDISRALKGLEYNFSFGSVKEDKFYQVL